MNCCSGLSLAGRNNASQGIFYGDIIITGDLTVEGATTTIESQVVTFADKILDLAYIADPSMRTDANISPFGFQAQGNTLHSLTWVNPTGWVFTDNLTVTGTVSATNFIPSGGPLNVASGGTGQNSLLSGYFLSGNGTSPVQTTKVAPSGVVVGDTDTQTLQNKTLIDTGTYFANISNTTKKLNFDLSGQVSSSTTTLQTFGTGNQIFQFPGVISDTLVTENATQDLANKDLSNPSNIFPTSLVTLTGVQTLTNKDLTSSTNTFPTSLVTLTGVQTLTNKTVTSLNANGTKITNGATPTNPTDFAIKSYVDGIIGTGYSADEVTLHLSGTVFSIKNPIGANLNLSSGFSYEINGSSVLSSTTLGSSVVSSSLTSVGTVTTGTWTTNINAPTIAAQLGLVVTNNGVSGGGNNHFELHNSGVARWGMGLRNAEGGANSGSDYYFASYSDAGGFLNEPIIIGRNTGTINIQTNSNSTIGLQWHNGVGTPLGNLSYATASASAGSLNINSGGTTTITLAGSGTSFLDTGGSTVFGGTASDTLITPAIFRSNDEQIHVSENPSGDGGGYIGSNADNQLEMKAGYYFNGVNFVAVDTEASSINLVSGGMYCYGNTGLTIGNSFTPTELFRMDPSGYMSAADGIEINTKNATGQWCVSSTQGTATHNIKIFTDVGTANPFNVGASINYTAAGFTTVPNIVVTSYNNASGGGNIPFNVYNITATGATVEQGSAAIVNFSYIAIGS